MAYSYIFERMEKKYLITPERYAAIFAELHKHMHGDEYGESVICNIYYDTAENSLISRSVEDPEYKEKFRLRSYGVPHKGSTVFLEIKKKYKGVVYKRRISMEYTEATDYLSGKSRPKEDNQILHEIDYMFEHYKLRPSYGIYYDRTAYYGNDDAGFRVTFDRNIRRRRTELDLGAGDSGTPLLPDGLILMEVKALGAMPKWLCDILAAQRVYSQSFSKYGTAFTAKNA